ncbi:MAG TPA: AAA family ATPase, partial [Thermoprotei archaeon]|nr:AAA family ATPase [Thermoprotei archaeon]
MANIIFITGTPGVGKTSVAMLLAKRLNLKIISMHNVAINICKKKYIKDFQSYEVDPIDLRNAIESLVKNIDNTVIVEGHIVEGVPSSLVFRVIVLRTHPKILEKRLRSKKYSEQKIRENILCEILDYVLIQCLKFFDRGIVCEVDTTNQTVEETVNIVEDILSKNSCGKYSVGKIDWISTLER